MSKQYKLNDKYYAVKSGGLSEVYRVELKHVEEITETTTGFKYDGLKASQMYDTFEAAKQEAIERTKRACERNIAKLENSKEPTRSKWL